MADEPIKRNRKALQSYHYAWLRNHPHRTLAWLKAMMREGFHVHHIDGDHSNDSPLNLILVDGTDHMRLHGMCLSEGLKRWRSRQSFGGRKPQITSVARRRSRAVEHVENRVSLPSHVVHSPMPLDAFELDPFVGSKWLADYYSARR